MQREGKTVDLVASYLKGDKRTRPELYYVLQGTDTKVGTNDTVLPT